LKTELSSTPAAARTTVAPTSQNAEAPKTAFEKFRAHNNKFKK